jgi:NADH-quinone oxidoreductase subunit L
MQQLWLIPILPLAGFLLNGFFGRRASKAIVNAVAVRLGIAVVPVGAEDSGALGAFSGSLEDHIRRALLHLDSIRVAEHRRRFCGRPLTAVMLMVVTGVGFLIHVYSIGYMAHEGGYYRFFAYLNLFMFFMLVLVLGANYLLLFVGWEGVGLCSYLLIGFYFLEKFATDAGNKAFIVNRIGDFGFSLAVF